MSEPQPPGGPAPEEVVSLRQRIRERLPALTARHLPITVWLPGYSRDWLRLDLVAGVTSWAVMVPVAMAYAGLAGVPPETGLVTAFAALAAYAILGTSRHLKVTTSSTMAIMSASVVGGVAAGAGDTYVALTAALALVVGVILIAGGIVRLGFISDFLSKSVITGFVFGLAITIIVGQLPKLFGVAGGSGNVFQQLAGLIVNLPDTNLYTLALGAGSLTLILVLRQVSRRIPGALIALVVGIAAVAAFDLAEKGVSLVGEVATGVPAPGLPAVSLMTIPFLAAGAAGMVFLAVGESIGAGRALAMRHHYEIDPDQELIGLGAANVASGLFGGFAVDASLSQTATAEAAGTKSQLSSLVTSGLILATAVVLAPLFKSLPNAVLGAIVIAAVLSLMDYEEMVRYYRWRRTDFAVALTAMIGVVLTTVLVGLVIAVLLSVLLLLHRASRPYIAVLGKLGRAQGTYADLSRHPRARRVPGLLILRLDAPLYYFNANVARGQILDLIAQSEPAPRAVLLDIGATSDLDVTTADMLLGLVEELRGRSVDVLLAQVKGSVRDRMRRTGLMELVGEDRIYLSTPAAVDDFRSWDREHGGRHPDPGATAQEDAVRVDGLPAEGHPSAGKGPAEGSPADRG